MKVLWLVNIAMPDVCEALGHPLPVLGGWLCGYRDALLSAYPKIELHIVEPYSGSTPTELETTICHHHLFPTSWQVEQMKLWLRNINETLRPDIVHLHGTESIHHLAWIETCGVKNVLVSIQGLTSIYARYFMGGLTQEDLAGCWSFNDYRWHRTLEQRQREFIKLGQVEIKLLKSVKHIAGRTSWDKAHTWSLNPEAEYHHLDEILRKPFYNEKYRWNLEHCQRHSIFISQGHYPIKGFHKMLEAMPLILRHYPDAELYVLGKAPTINKWRHRSTYENVLRKLILSQDIKTHDCLELASHVHYLGTLDADQMVEQYRQANVFVCPSAIENSCNSVCEAQLLGCPVVASYVGGLMDLVDDGETGLLYRFEETEMLAGCVCRIFGNDSLASTIGRQAHTAAYLRHNRENIARTLFNIYTELSHGS